MKFAIALVSLFLLQEGCDQTKPTPTPPTAQVKRERPPIHRFESVPGVGQDGIALDTVTGQWCKTWEWVPRDPKAPTDGLSSLPTCLNIYLGYPDTEAELSPSAIK
jgi:hypothetical protein